MPLDQTPPPDAFDTASACWSTVGAGTPHPQEWSRVERYGVPYFLVRETNGQLRVFTVAGWRALVGCATDRQ